MTATENGQIPAALKADAQKAKALQDTIDYKALATFWHLKYVELSIHSNQIVVALSRPMLTEQAMAQLQAQAAQAAAQT